jgi:hypothetical protein
MGSRFGERRRSTSILFATCLVVGMLIAPAAANAQSSGYTEYAPSVGTAGSTASGGGKSPNSGTAGANNSGVAGDAVSGGNGKSLAFTGYPLTPLVALVAILLAAGFVLRVVMPRLDRRHI